MLHYHHQNDSIIKIGSDENQGSVAKSQDSVHRGVKPVLNWANVSS